MGPDIVVADPSIYKDVGKPGEDDMLAPGLTGRETLPKTAESLRLLGQGKPYGVTR